MPRPEGSGSVEQLSATGWVCHPYLAAAAVWLYQHGSGNPCPTVAGPAPAQPGAPHVTPTDPWWAFSGRWTSKQHAYSQPRHTFIYDTTEFTLTLPTSFHSISWERMSTFLQCPETPACLGLVAGPMPGPALMPKAETFGALHSGVNQT